MRTGVFITLLVVSAFHAIGADSKAADIPKAAEIIDAWNKRANNFQSGKISWKIPLEGWNIFGRFETDWVPDSTPVDQEITGTLSFAGQFARYDSFSLSYPDFGYSSSRKSTERKFYRTALNAGFQLHNHEYRELLPYTVILSPNKRIHYWSGNERVYPCSIILPAIYKSESLSLANLTKYNSDSHIAPSGGSSATLHQSLAAPVLLTFRPFLYDRSLEQTDTILEVSESRPTYEGRSCAVLSVKHIAEAATAEKTEASINKKDFPKPTKRIYWVDPSRDFVVVRCIDMKGNKSSMQIDIHYDQVAGIGWVPHKWTALQYGPKHNAVQKIATAVRTGINMGQPISDASMKISFPPGTGVIDTLADRRYIVCDDMSKYECFQEIFNVFNHKELVAMSKKDVQWSGNRQINSGRQIVVWLLNWPGSLIPVSLIIVILISINSRLVHRRNSRSKSTDSQMDTY